MNETELRTYSNLYNSGVNQGIGIQEIYNSAANWSKIQELYDTGRAKDLSSEVKKKNKPCIITGSGATLDDKIGLMREWKGDIVCHYSQAPTLIRYGIIPDYIVLVDAICNWEGLSCNGKIDWSKYKTKLVTHPGMWPSMIANWPNEILLYRQNLGRADAFGINEQKNMYMKCEMTLSDALQNNFKWRPIIKTELLMFACTPPTQLVVSKVLEYGPIYLVGLDFCYVNQRERFSDWEKTDTDWIKHERILPPRAEPYVKTSNGYDTDPIHLFYKKNFLSAARLTGARLFTTGGPGALKEFPDIAFDKVIQGVSPPDIPSQMRADKIDEYLARVGCYVLSYTSGALRFVEAKNPEKDLIAFMTEQNKLFYCTSCGQQCMAIVPDAKDGDRCPACGSKTLKSPGCFDIQKNIDRITRILRRV